MTTDKATFVPEMLEEAQQRALVGALERILESSFLETAWPAAFEAKQCGAPISSGDISMVVLPLDRIGAPAGASGANVYIAYYSHSSKVGPVRAASPPLVVKIGEERKLKREKESADDWPSLSMEEKQRFALPFHLDLGHPEWAVLIALFQSKFDLVAAGTRNNIKVRDLWRLLADKEELLGLDDNHWEAVSQCISQALDAVNPPHRATLAQPQRKQQPYGTAYSLYLRKTTGAGELSHVPRLIFGEGATVSAFGQTWDNPISIVEEIVSSRVFSGFVGAVHGDLHPKNIVINSESAARIIDFGWAKRESHIVQDYLLLDINLRGTTLPSQTSEADVLALAGFLDPSEDVDSLPLMVRRRARIIKDVVWKKATSRAVENWESEYLVPLLLVGYGLLVHLDRARNQPALVATVLATARAIRTRTLGGAP